MTEFFNPYTKTRFSVADDRIEEYKAAGFPLAADSEKPKIEVEESKAEEIPGREDVIEEVPEPVKEKTTKAKATQTASKKAKK